jgi:hypothetical protein
MKENAKKKDFQGRKRERSKKINNISRKKNGKNRKLLKKEKALEKTNANDEFKKQLLNGNNVEDGREYLSGDKKIVTNQANTENLKKLAIQIEKEHSHIFSAAKNSNLEEEIKKQKEKYISGRNKIKNYVGNNAEVKVKINSLLGKQIVDYLKGNIIFEDSKKNQENKNRFQINLNNYMDNLNNSISGSEYYSRIKFNLNKQVLSKLEESLRRINLENENFYQEKEDDIFGDAEEINLKVRKNTKNINLKLSEGMSNTSDDIFKYKEMDLASLLSSVKATK